MSTNAEIEKVVVDFIFDRTGLPQEEVPKDKNLLGAGVLDSFGFMEMILHLEQFFGLSVPIDEHVLENYGSVGAIVASIDRQLRAR